MSSKEEKINSFNPNSAGVADSQMFGLPFTIDESDIVLLPVPWEVTVSYGGGASEGPEHIFESSLQVDLHHPEFPELWKKGIAMLEQNGALHSRSNSLKKGLSPLRMSSGNKLLKHSLFHFGLYHLSSKHLPKRM